MDCRPLQARPGFKQELRRKQAAYWTPERRATQAERAKRQRANGTLNGSSVEWTIARRANQSSLVKRMHVEGRFGVVTPQERKRRSERAKRMHAEGKLDGGKIEWTPEMRAIQAERARGNTNGRGNKGKKRVMHDV